MEGLDQLQLRIKQDPEANKEPFLHKWEEFIATIDVIKLTPHLYNVDAMNLLNFISHTVSFYSDCKLDVDEICLGSVNENCIAINEVKNNKGYQLCLLLLDFVKTFRNNMNSKMRKLLISSTFLLRNKRQIDIFTLVSSMWLRNNCILPEWLSLLDLDDKEQRKRLFVFIIRDLTILHRHVRNQKVVKGVQKLVCDRLSSSSIQIQLISCCICVEMYKRNLWRDVHIVNTLANCTLSKNIKMALAATHFLLGTHNHFDVVFVSLVDEVAEEDLKDKLKDINRIKSNDGKMKRVKKSLEKQLQRRKTRDSENYTFRAIYDIYDPQGFTDKLFDRATGKDVTFSARLLFLKLIAILIAKHQLLVPNFYVFMLKYLNHKQKLVTKALAITAQAIHPNIPIELIKPILRQIIQQFTADDRPDDIITIGINTIREIVQRSPLALDRESLAQLAEFKNYKCKSVTMATRALINLYRSIMPELLHPNLRGREAGTLLCKSRREGGQKLQLSSTRILTDDDFNTNNIYDQPNEHVDDDVEENGEDEDSDESSSLAETDTPYHPTLPDTIGSANLVEGNTNGELQEDDYSSDTESSVSDGLVDESELHYGSRKSFTCVEKRSKMFAVRKEKKLLRRIARSKGGKKQSTTNRVKARNKPALMALKSKKVRNKQSKSIAERMSILKQHIKSLKKGNMKRKKRRS